MTTTPPVPAIRAEALHQSFTDRHGGRVHALKGVDLSIGSGEIVGLLGPNGAGKSTLVDLLLGLTSPRSGTVQVLGRTPRQAVAEARTGAVLQTGGLLPDLTVRDTVRMIAATHQNPMDPNDALARADLTGLARRRVGSCSGGEQQRLRFALAILASPDLLILDEPTAGMDAGARHAFWEAMRDQAEAGRTILFATHYLEEAQQFASRIVMLSDGRVVADGPTAQVRDRAAARRVTALLPDDVDPAALPGVQAVETSGEGSERRTTLTTTDSDALARYLLTRTDARDLSISPASLEEAFLTLTGPAPDAEPSADARTTSSATPGSSASPATATERTAS